MVEGPGNKLKGEKMRGTVVGQKVKKVMGSAVRNGGAKYQVFEGKTVTDVKTLGKELFIILDHHTCIRVHFLMNGYVRYNKKVSDPDESARAGGGGEGGGGDEKGIRGIGDALPLELEMSRDLVSLHQCQVQVRDLQPELDRWERMITLDICWPSFDHARAAQVIMAETNQGRLVVDVVMDQGVLPGVGNIIKNEALYDARVAPLALVGALGEGVVRRLVRMTRDFSLLFYECRRTGKNLAAHYRVYRKDCCPLCSVRLVRCHPGVLKRGTYFCRGCQDNREQVVVPGSLQALFTPSPWTCTACTLHNKAGNSSCSACASPRPAARGGPGGLKLPRPPPGSKGGLKLPQPDRKSVV